MIPQFELYDACLLIIYLFVIYLVAILYTQKRQKENSIYRYFIPGLSIKLAGGIVYAFYHVYIYKGGDTFVFYNAASDLVSYVSIFEPYTFGAYWNVFDSSVHDFSPMYNYILNGADVLFMVKLTSFTYCLGAGSYYTVTLLFSAFSFLGLWYGFLTFSKLYPQLKYYFFLAAFCVPTMVLWSSGVLKDTITIGAIGWLIYGFANLFIFSVKPRLSLFHIVISSVLIFMLKSYLIYLLYPAFFIWVQSNVKAKISSRFLRNILSPLLIVSMV